MATIFPSSPTVGQIYQGYEWNGTAWVIIGIDLTQDYATQTELNNHESDTTNVHGISNSANLVYTNDSRLGDSRTPISHASTHQLGGSDSLTLSQSQVTNLTTDLASKAPIASPTFTGTVTVPTPVNSTDAATKIYVDNIAQGLHVHAPCAAATPNTLASLTGGTVTYNNGTSGVGATLTLQNALTTLDGRTLQNGDRILVKNETNAANNGIYTWATGGTVLTRASDYNTPTEMAGGDFTFVQNGTLYNDTGWVMTDPVTTVGTTAVNFVQFSGAGTYSAGTGLVLNGTEFSNTGVLSLTGATDEINVSASSGNITLSVASAIARLQSPNFTGTVTFANNPKVGSGGSPTTITVDGTVITQMRDTYAFATGGNALQFYYANLPVNASHLAAAQSVTNGTQITVFDGTSTYTFTATGAGFETSMGGNLIVIPGTGNGSGYYSTGAYAIIPGGSAPTLVTDSFVSSTYAPIESPTFTGITTVASPTAAGSTGVRNITMSTSNPSGGNDGDMWVVYAP